MQGENRQTQSQCTVIIWVPKEESPCVDYEESGMQPDFVIR